MFLNHNHNPVGYKNKALWGTSCCIWEVPRCCHLNFMPVTGQLDSVYICIKWQNCAISLISEFLIRLLNYFRIFWVLGMLEDTEHTSSTLVQFWFLGANHIVTSFCIHIRECKINNCHKVFCLCLRRWAYSSNSGPLCFYCDPLITICHWFHKASNFRVWFNEVFLGYQLHQVSVWNWCFKDHLSPHHQGSGTYKIPDDGDRWSLKHQFHTDTWRNL